MDWREEGVVLSRRRHGESAAIVEIFTEGHGRHAGIVRGGGGRRMGPVLEPGNQVDAAWRARLEDHLGVFTVEPVVSRAAVLMADRRTLAGLNAVCSLLSFALPEREPHPGLYRQTQAVLGMMGEGPYWPIAYLRWELALLEEMGFGLDLSSCAVTGSAAGLSFVSPKSGRAVSEAGAGAFKDRLLPLSPALVGRGEGSAGDLRDGFRTTGHFLRTWLAPALGDRPMPEARQRLVDLLSR